MSDYHFNFLKIFTEQLQKKLNGEDGSQEATSDLKFKLFPDTGRFKRSFYNLDLRERKFVKERPINGVCFLSTSEITPNQQNSLIAAVTIRTEIVVPCAGTEQTRENVKPQESASVDTFAEGNEKLLDEVRTAIDTLCAQQTFDTLPIKSRSYAVSYAYEFLNTGSRQSRPKVGDSMTFSFNAYISIIESGENSRADAYFLDGQPIPYLTAIAARRNSTELDVFNGSGIAKATVGSSSFTIKFNFPSYIAKFNDAIKKYLIGNEEPNAVHVLQVIFGSYSDKVNNEYVPAEKFYLVTFDNTDRAAQGVSNVGLSVQFVEAYDDYELIKMPSAFEWGDGINAPYSPNTIPGSAGTKYKLYTDIPTTFVLFNRETDGYVIGTCNDYDENNRRYLSNIKFELSSTQINNILFITQCAVIGISPQTDG